MNNLFKKSVSMVALVTMLTSSVPAVFAATIADGDLVKASGSSAVYLVSGTTLRTFPYSTIYHSWGYPSNYSTVKTVAASDLVSYTVGDPVPFRDGTCFRGTAKSLPGFESQAVFCVSDGQLRPVESQNAFFGLFNVTNWTQGNKYVQYIPDDFLSKFDYAFGTKITETEVNSGFLMNGMVVRGSVDGAYYLVQDGNLRSISNAAAAANKIDLSTAVVTAQTKINAISSALPVSTTVETSLVTPKTKVQAQQGGSTTDLSQASKLVVTSDQSSVNADGISQVTISAKVATTAGATVSSATNTVTFAITSGTGTLSATTVAAVNGVATVKLTPSTVASTIVISASATGLTAGTVSVTATANTNAPQVVSISNQGMRIINVAFDKVVDQTSAETTSNYIPKNDKSSTVSVINAKLLADGKTVQLFLASGFYNNSIVDSLEVKNVQDAAQTVQTPDMTKEFTMADSSVPTVVSAEALGSKALRVTFSEAVQGLLSNSGLISSPVLGSNTVYNAFRLDDKALRADAAATLSGISNYVDQTVITYPDAGDYTKALISFNNPITVGAHTLTVSYNGVITDYNVTTDGTANVNVSQPAGYVVTVAADTSVPQLSNVEIVTQTKIRYTFSKNVDVKSYDGTTGDTFSPQRFFWSTSANATSGTFASQVKKISDVVYEVTWGSAINTGSVYFYAGTTSNPVKDYSGNSISPLPSSKMLTVTTDTAPSISSVSTDTDSDRVVIVYFNKDVEQASAESSSNYVFKDSNGVVLTSTTGGNAIGSNGTPTVTPKRDPTNLKKVVITLGDSTQDSNALPGGTYQLTVTGVKTSGGTTAMNAQTSTFSVTDKTRPTLYSTNEFTNGTNILASTNRIVVKYSEPMGASALIAENYKVNGMTISGTTYSTLTKLSDISGVTLSFRNSNKDVAIDFPVPSTGVNSLNGTLVIGYIDGSVTKSPTDVAGNYFNAKDTNLSTSLTGTVVASSAALDLSTTGATGIISSKITSTTTLEVVFGRDIDQISSSEFVIKNGANTSGNMVPTSAVIDTTDHNKVVFTIPSGTANEFTANDGIVGGTTVTLATQSSTLSTTKDILGLLLANNKVSTIATTNNIKPILKSFVLSDAKTLVLTFDGKIKTSVAANDLALANDLIVSQVVGTTTTTLTGSQLAIATTVYDSTVVTVTLSGSATLSLIDPVTVRTVTQDSMTSVGSNNASLAANTGLTNSGFVATAITEGFVAGTGYGLTADASLATANGQIFSITFNKNVDKNSLISSSWVTYAGNIGGASDTKWVQSNNVSNAVSFDPSTDKITFNGINLGEVAVSNNILTSTGSIVSLPGNFVYDETTRTVYVYVTGAASPAATVSLTDTAATASTLTYTPNSGIKTDTVGTPISSDFKPVAIMN